jgi:hydrogenase nickel incorporation protein HypA/HybF
MHEYSIVQSLLDSCEENARANDASKVTKIIVKIGVMSGVEPHLLEIAFNTFKEHTMCEDAEFIVNIQKVLIKCNNCNEESELEDNQYACPKCDGYDLEILDGEDMFLMSLELE